MNESKTQFGGLISRIKNNPIVASLILLSSIVIALSTFTDAMRNLWGLVVKETRPDINGEWQAEVTYDWPNARYVEMFTFRGGGDEVYGTASFLGIKRGILSGRISKDKVRFTTKSQEFVGDGSEQRDVIRRYEGRIIGDKIEFSLQTEGGNSGHVPIEFTARKARSVPPQDTR